MKSLFGVSSGNATDERGLSSCRSTDVSRILQHYDQINYILGDEFWDELNAFIAQAAENPQRFHLQGPNLRRVNLKRFPYHFLFREIPGGIRITVVRHHRKHPNYGLGRG